LKSKVILVPKWLIQRHIFTNSLQISTATTTQGYTPLYY